MNCTPSITHLYQPSATSAGMDGMVCDFTVITRLWLAYSRKTNAARPDENVIG